MANIDWKTTKRAPKNSNHLAPICRRCGTECVCSEEEIDAGGPA